MPPLCPLTAAFGTFAPMRVAVLLAVAVPCGLVGCGGGPSTDVGTVRTGTPITVKSTKYQVDHARIARSVRDELRSHTPEGAFVVVTLKVTVTGDQGRLFSRDAAKVITRDGKSHEPDMGASELTDPRAHLLGEDLIPNTTKTGDLVFDIPVDALTGTRLKVRDLLSNDYGFIELNP